jgi:PIN domain nuclease of toxin-antitoxin system
LGGKCANTEEGPAAELMRVLLDTHTLLWALVTPARLSPKARAIIENPENDRIVSSASAWEIATKFRIGKLPQAESVVRDYAAHLATLRARELPMTSQHALAAGLWQTAHRDPFDRVLAAQSLIEGLALITNDAAMGQFGIKTLW